MALVPTSEGGRSAPIKRGYRSLIRFEGSDLDFGFELADNGDVIEPGESGTARLRFWASEELPKLTSNTRFEIREGTRVVGTGKVVEIES